jgi:hypothetical protein
MIPTEFKVFDIKNALMDYECNRLIQLYDDKHINYINEFHGFDIEYIIKRVEDIAFDLTNYDIKNQEPIYISKNKKDDPSRIDAWMDGSKNIELSGNRVFTVLFFLSEGSIVFPKIKLQHIAKSGDAIIWNNVVKDGRIEDAVHQISPDTYYIKKWVREKEFNG